MVFLTQGCVEYVNLSPVAKPIIVNLTRQPEVLRMTSQGVATPLLEVLRRSPIRAFQENPSEACYN